MIGQCHGWQYKSGKDSSDWILRKSGKSLRLQFVGAFSQSQLHIKLHGFAHVSVATRHNCFLFSWKAWEQKSSNKQGTASFNSNLPLIFAKMELSRKKHLSAFLFFKDNGDDCCFCYFECKMPVQWKFRFVFPFFKKESWIHPSVVFGFRQMAAQIRTLSHK